MTDQNETRGHGRAVQHIGALPPPDLTIAEWQALLRSGLPSLREARGWTQRDLAQRSGLHRRTIMRIETTEMGQRQPGTQTLNALTRAFGYVHLGDLWMALHGAGSADPRTPLIVGERLRRIVLAIVDCSPEQQQLIEGLALCWAAIKRAEASGVEQLLDLEALLRRG